jgi:hypothetical protein
MAKSNAGVIVAALVVIVLVVAGVFVFYKGGTNSSTNLNTTGNTISKISQTSTIVPTTTSNSTNNGTSGNTAKKTPVMVTDPAQVPTGTKALVMSYSSVQTQSGAGAGWVQASGSGSINLTSAVNSSVVVGYINTTAQSTVSAVRIYATSAYIIVNGTTYNATVPSYIAANVTGSTKVGSNSSVIVEVSPTVAAVYTSNSTRFAMNPSSKAVVVANATASGSVNVGSLISLNAQAKAALWVSTPNISISEPASVTVDGNTTYITVDVMDNSNRTVVLNSLIVYGAQNVSASQSASTNASVVSSLNSALLGGRVSANASANVKAMLGVGLNIRAFQSATFSVSQPAGSYGSYTYLPGGYNLTLVSNSSAFSGGGLTIAPATTVILKYEGRMSYDSGAYHSRLVVGAPYNVVVTGSDGATSSVQTTATAYG